jgi:hypothetical protein
MATQTLAELAKFVQDDLVGGVAEDIITVSPIFNFLPFQGYSGDAVVVNRETTLGDAGLYSVSDAITHRTPSTSTPLAFTATKLIGQVDIDGLVQAQGESDGVDMTAQEMSSKSKSLSRLFQQEMVSGTGVAPSMHSLHSMIDSEQFATASALERDLSFELMDELLDLVVAKDGEVDFLMGHSVLLRKYRALYRALGGAQPQLVVIQMPDGTERTVESYNGIPFFRNDYLSVAETADGAALTGGDMTSLWAGVWDDGSRKVGLSAIYPESVDAGIMVKNVGTSETLDEDIYRLVWYTNFVNFNRRALARLASLATT